MLDYKKENYALQNLSMSTDIKTQVSNVKKNGETLIEYVLRGYGTFICVNHDEYTVNCPGGLHAEALMMKRFKPGNIMEIHIKNSPCSDCARKLIDYFWYVPKPTIYVGRIWRLKNHLDRLWLKKMIHQGFRIKVWSKLHAAMYPADTITDTYI